MHDYTKFFKSNSGYNRFVKGIYDKYRSLGKFTGMVKLKKLSSDEANVLSRLFGVSMNSFENVNLSIKKFLKIMSESKYNDFDIAIFISEYFDISLESKSAEKAKKRETEMEFYEQFCVGNSLGNAWMREVVSQRDVSFKIIHERYNKDKVSLEREIVNIISYINNLPQESTLLSIYSASITGDPHYLDLDGTHSSLFFYALCYLDEIKYPVSREDKILLLSKFNILIDNLSNSVITYKLISDSNAINEFSKNDEALVFTMQNIMNRKVFSGISDCVFVFENPSILSYIIANKLNISVVIVGGFPNTCVYLLLDKLVKNGCALYYNGDFDPEGLLIAQMLKDRYEDKINLLCYDKESYVKSKSKKLISESRLKKLDKVFNRDLIVMKKLLYENCISGYQENLMDMLMMEIKKVCLNLSFPIIVTKIETSHILS